MSPNHIDPPFTSQLVLHRFAVATVMFVTTTLIAIQMVSVKHLSIFIAIGFFVIFGFFDGESMVVL